MNDESLGEHCAPPDSGEETDVWTPLALLSSSERRRNCGLTPLATSQQHNQGALSPAQRRRLRLLLEPTLERYSSEEELERISRDFLQGGAGEGVRWALHPRHAELSSNSSDEEVKDLCGPVESGSCVAAPPSPVLFSASPPRSLRPLSRGQARPIILSHFEQPAAPYRRLRPGYGGESGRPSLDLEKMQQVGPGLPYASSQPPPPIPP